MVSRNGARLLLKSLSFLASMAEIKNNVATGNKDFIKISKQFEPKSYRIKMEPRRLRQADLIS